MREIVKERCGMSENKAKETQVYTGIDVFKLIAAVLVVLLHTVETSNYYACAIKEVFTRLAVPFFFIASGFFFQKGLEKAQSKVSYIKKYEKNILKIFFVWTVVMYSPFVVYSYITNNVGESSLRIVGMLIRRIFIIGPGPYWYLVTLFWSSLFIYFCYVKKKENFLFIAIMVGFCMQILYSCFRGAFSKIFIFEMFFKVIYGIFSWEYNFLMYGIPFMGIGYFFSKKKIHMSKKKASILLIIATLFSMVEYSLPRIIPSAFWINNRIFLAFIVQAIAYFLIAESMAFKISKKRSLSIRQLSSFIYFSHVILLYEILNRILDNFTTLPTYEPIMILPKFLIIIGACIVLFLPIKKINNKHLNILING